MGRSINKKGQNSRKRMMEETAEETATRLEKAKNKRENEELKHLSFCLSCPPSTVQC